MNKKYAENILDKIVLIGIALTIILLLFTPLGITAILKSVYGVVGSKMPINISIGIYICAIPYLIALIYLKKLCGLIAKKDPFSTNIPLYLKKISMCAFSEVLIFNVVQFGLYYLFDMYFYALTLVPSVIISFVALAIGFLSVVLSKLFEMAIEIKDENDKTI